MIRSVLPWTRSFVVLVPLVLACSSGNQKDAEVPTGDTNTVTDKGMDDVDQGNIKTPPPSTSEPSGGAGGLTAMQKEQMEVVLKRGARKAENCSTSVPDGKGGEGEVKVVFDGQKGKVTEVTVGPPWVGTSMESCIKRAFLDEYIVPFEGDPLEVPYTIKVPEKAGATTDPKKPGKK